MASKKFQRKIEEVAGQVMDPGEQFVAGVAGQAGSGAVSKLGSPSQQVYNRARLAAYATGDMFNALAILSDEHVYLVSTPPLKAYEVKDVVLKMPASEAEVELKGKNRLRIDDFTMTYMRRMGSEAEKFVDLASQPPA
jgi:hypothetical protein